MFFFIRMDNFFSMDMEIPEKLAKNFKGQICENVEVRGPSGVTWHVKMIRYKGKLIFQSGWKDFITANKIRKNDILVFKYNGKSSFEVVIFDASGCEKVAPFFAKKMGTDQLRLQESSDSSVQVVAELNSVIKQDFICIPSGDNETSNGITSEDAKFCKTGKRVVQKSAIHGERDSEAMPRKRTRSGAQTRMLKSASLKLKAPMIKSPYVIPRFVHLTSAQEKIALEMSCAAKPGNATFVRLLNSSNVAVAKTCQINFPVKFAPSLKKLESQRLILRRHGEDKEWHARYFSSYSGGICGAGLRDFISENNLKKGDLCLFELMENEPKLAMTVHVLKVK